MDASPSTSMRASDGCPRSEASVAGLPGAHTRGMNGGLRALRHSLARLVPACSRVYPRAPPRAASREGEIGAGPSSFVFCHHIKSVIQFDYTVDSFPILNLSVLTTHGDSTGSRSQSRPMARCGRACPPQARGSHRASRPVGGRQGLAFALAQAPQASPSAPKGAPPVCLACEIGASALGLTRRARRGRQRPPLRAAPTPHAMQHALGVFASGAPCPRRVLALSSPTNKWVECSRAAFRLTGCRRPR